MKSSNAARWQRGLTFLAALLILKVTASVILDYRDYFPPNFGSDFLRGRESYFSGAYHWAFYTHIAAGPVSLILGLMLISERFRMRFPKWHRALGKVEAALVLLLLTPSGLWMAYYPHTGGIAARGFSLLAIVMAVCVLCGWRSAVKKRFAEHRRWMWRSFLLLCSAVILRLMGGLADITEVGGDWSYPLSAWTSWLLPLAAFELCDAMNRQFKRSGAPDKPQLSPSAADLSLPAMEISARR